MILLAAVVLVMVTLSLVGRTAKERLVIRTETNRSRQVFPPGMTRVEFDSVDPKIKIVGNIYIPDDYQDGERRAGLIVSPPATSVKEQAAHEYAEKLRLNGYICLTFDPRGIGETKGLEGNVNPYTTANDIASGVSYLQSLPQVDDTRLGSLGLCAHSVSSTYEAIQDPRVKALALAVPVVDGAQIAGGDHPLMRELLYFLGGIARLLGVFGVHPKLRAFPQAFGKANEVVKNMPSYYAPGAVGFHPRYKNQIAFFSGVGTAVMDGFKLPAELDIMPVCIISGEKAESLKPAEQFFRMLNGPAEKLILKISGSSHFDLYWKEEYVDQAVAELDKFFRKYIQCQ